MFDLGQFYLKSLSEITYVFLLHVSVATSVGGSGPNVCYIFGLGFDLQSSVLTVTGPTK